MPVIETLIERNADFVRQHFTPNMPLSTALGITVIGCLDPRVDPAYVLGLKQGDAAIIRNIGGRVNPATLRELELIGSLPKRLGAPIIAQGMHIVVLHHTNCGITLLAKDPTELAPYFDVEPEDLHKKAVLDPFTAVKIDTDLLKQEANVPAGTVVTGLVYDIATGQISVVVPTTPLAVSAQQA